jgi:hypothetical protein
MLLVGEQVAKREAAADPRKQFLAEDAVNDLYHLYQMRALQPGQQHVWSSPYRYDIETQYGREFMTSCGRFPDRKMGFLYRASCDEQGNVVLESQTVDRSDEAAFGAVDTYAAQHPSARMGELVAQYDGVLVGKHGGEFYAGRRGAEVNENVWQTMLEHRDLVEYFLDKLEALAWGSLEGSDLEEAAKRHVYGVWAAFKRRIDGIGTAAQSSEYRPKQQGVSILGMVRLEQEVHQAFRQFAAQGQVMAGCGGAIAMRAGLDIMNASGAEVFNTIFGETEDKFGSLSFTCPKGHYNTRPFGRLIDNCRTCRASVRC